MSTLTQEQWDSYKSQFPNDEKIQAVTLEELLKNTNGGKIDWGNLRIAEESGVEDKAEAIISDCELAIGFVIFDVVCLAINGVGLRSGLSKGTAKSIAKAAKPVLSKIKVYIGEIAAKGASKTDRAKAVFKILTTIWTGGCLSAVISAFLRSLSWYYALLYGAMALGTIAAVVATDGVAFVGEIVVELATFGFLVADSVKVVKVCG